MCVCVCLPMVSDPFEGRQATPTKLIHRLDVVGFVHFACPIDVREGGSAAKRGECQRARVGNKDIQSWLRTTR